MSSAILGINCHAHDSSVALIQDGRIVFAAAEERFSRTRKDRRFPHAAIRAALTHADLQPAELTAVAFGWNRPGLGPLHTIRAALAGELPRSRGWTTDQLVHLASEVRRGGGVRPFEKEFGPLDRGRAFFIDHHEAHAWSSYALSGFDDALVLVMDGWGAWQSTTIYHAQGERLRPLRTFRYPNSLGVLYESFTDLLGFERNSDEWKVMGLAAYGQPTVPLQDWIQVTREGYRVNGRLLSGRSYGDLSALTRRFGARRDPETFIAEGDRDLAASVQQATEAAIFALVRAGLRRTGSRRVCLAGGVAMNSKANGRLLASGLVDALFVQPAATDDGTAIGAALAAHARLGQPIPRYRLREVYLGPAYSDDELAQTLQAYQLRALRVPQIEEAVAALLAQGHIVGWFQGRMEFGPRALGNRSILADPRRPEMKDRVNASVKFREGWRPFAPACLAEAAPEYFDGCQDAPFMIVTFTVRPDKRAAIPAVTHADGTARVQTVREPDNPRFWRLLRAFGRRTGVPVLLNTSFNLRGEPIVCSPKDAIRTFYSSGLDFLALGSFLIPKDPLWEHLAPYALGRVSQNGVSEADVVIGPPLARG